MWSHEENVDCPHLYHVIMGSYTLIVGVLKYFLFWGFVRFEFYRLGLLSCGALVHFGFSLSTHVIAWQECWLSTPVSCDHGIVHLDCWSIKIFSLLGVLSALSFIRWGFCPMVLFVHFGFSLSTHVKAWRECWLSTLESCDHEIVHLDCWSIKIFSLLGVLSALSFILWFFCPMVLLSILAFLCPPTWSHDENVDCPHLYHVIMGSYTLIVGGLKYFLFWGFCLFWFLSFWGFCPMVL